MKTRILIFVVVAGLVAVAFTGCNLLGGSVLSRLTTFASDLNNSRAQVYTNFDSTPGSVVDYNAMKAAAYWDQYFPAPLAGQATYSVNIISSSDPANVSATISGPPSFSATGTARNARFVMVMVGTDYFIQQIFLLDISATVPIAKDLK